MTLRRAEPYAAGNVRVIKVSGGKGEYAAAILFPIGTRCDSGVAHVLEHVLSCSKNKYGRSLRDLRENFADVSINAVTECDRMVFFATCTTVEAFSAAVACLLELPDIPIEPALVRQEGFRQVALKSGSESHVVASGVVYNEMKSVFYTESRQLVLGTSEQLFDGSFSHDPGGDPEVLRHVTPPQVSRFAEEYVTHANAFLLVQGDEEAIGKVVRSTHKQFPLTHGMSAQPSRPRRRRDFGTHLYDGNDGVYFHRYALRLGKSLDPNATFVSWAIEGALKEFLPALAQVGARMGGEYLPHYSGTFQTGPDLHLVITFREDRPDVDHRQLLDVVVKQYLVDYVCACPPIKHLSHSEIQLRERYLAYERGTPSGLLMICDYLLYGSLEELNRLPDDLERARHTLSKPDALRGALSAAFSIDFRKIVLPPSRRVFREVMSREGRILRRLLRESAENPVPVRSAGLLSGTLVPPPWSAALHADHSLEPIGILNTGGIAYCHLVFNVSKVDADLLPFLPLAAHVIVGAADALGPVSLQCSPFAQWASTTDASVFLAVRMKWIRRTAPQLEESDPKEYLMGHLEAVAQCVSLRKVDVDSFVNSIMQNPMGVLFAQAGSDASAAARITGLWSGFSQVRLLQEYESDEVVSVLSEPVLQLIRQLCECPHVSFLFDEGTDASQALGRLSVLIAESSWRNHRYSRGLRASASTAFPVVAGVKGLPSILVKYSMVDLDPARIASVCIAVEALDSSLFTPVLRDSLGSYGVFFGRDQTLNQLFIGVYQTPSLLECSRHLARLASILDQMPLDGLAVSSLRTRTLMRFGLAESALNKLVIAAYDQCLGREHREHEIMRCIRTIPLRQAISEASAFFGSSQPSMSATCTSTLDVQVELGLDCVDAVVLPQR